MPDQTDPSLVGEQFRDAVNAVLDSDNPADRAKSIKSYVGEGWDGKDRPFAEYMVLVDHLCDDMAGCSVFDLPDVDFRALFAEGYSAANAVRVAMKAGGLS